MKTSKKLTIYKIKNELRKRILFFNIKNKNIKDLAYREYCYNKLKKKYKKLLIKDTDSNNTNDISNIVWTCWFQGYEQSPKLVKRCIESMKINFKDKEVIVIDEQNFTEYVNIPEYIIEKWKKGKISYAHFSDILRLELLIKYGGLWLDSTCYISSVPKKENNINFFMYRSLSLNTKDTLCVKASNWFIYSHKQNNILKLTLKLLYKYWEDYNYTINYNIFHIFFSLSTEIYEDEWKNVPNFSNIPPHILQFELLNNYSKDRYEQITSMSCIHKLNYRVEDNSKEYTNFKYILGESNNE